MPESEPAHHQVCPRCQKQKSENLPGDIGVRELSPAPAKISHRIAKQSGSSLPHGMALQRNRAQHTAPNWINFLSILRRFPKKVPRHSNKKLS
jgi:hypothetical protein